MGGEKRQNERISRSRLQGFEIGVENGFQNFLKDGAK